MAEHTDTTQTQKMYKQVAVLHKDQHRDLYLDRSQGFDFAREVSAVILTVGEFRRAAVEYPIVFTDPSESQPSIPMALLGLKNDQNLFLDAEAAWDALYVPAYIRRYPFVLVNSSGPDAEAVTFTLGIDDSFVGVNREQRGERLFQEDGEQTPFLQEQVKFVQKFQQDHDRSRGFCQELQQLDLFEPMRLNVDIPDRKPLVLSGFSGIKRERLKELQPDALATLMKSGALELIYAHLLSLNNVHKMIQRFTA